MAAEISASAEDLATPPPPPAAALALVPGLEAGRAALRVEALGGGTVNQVYRVDSPAGRFVLRIDGAAWRRPGVDRARELLLHRMAAAGGIAPAIIAADTRHGWLVTEFHDGVLWRAQDYTDPAALRRLAETLYRLHRLAPAPVEPFDPLRVGRDYARLVSADLAPARDEAMRRLEASCAGLAQGTPPLAVVHGDLWEGNLLQARKLWLLDWEYAQLAEPLMDIACLLAYYPQAAPLQDDLLAAAGFDARRDRGALAERVEIYRMLSRLWHLARGEVALPA
jgi:aminoglycoside phosphotransferase (APT) family kinase protein